MQRRASPDPADVLAGWTEPNTFTSTLLVVLQISFFFAVIQAGADLPNENP